VAYPRVLRAGTLRLPARIRLDPVRTGRRGPRLSLAHQGLRGPLVRPDLAQGRSAIRPAAFRSPFPPHPPEARPGLEVQFDLQAVRIDHEDLHRAVARHDLLSKRHAGPAQLRPRAFQIDAAKADVIEVARAHRRVFSRGTLHEMDDRIAACVHPVPDRLKRRPRTDSEPDNAQVEVLRGL